MNPKKINQLDFNLNTYSLQKIRLKKKKKNRKASHRLKENTHKTGIQQRTQSTRELLEPHKKNPYAVASGKKIYE